MRPSLRAMKPISASEKPPFETKKEPTLSFRLKGEAARKFESFRQKLKERGLARSDLKRDALISEALLLVPEHFWKGKLEALTPLSHRVKLYLEDPSKQKELEAFLRRSDHAATTSNT